eukprot:Gb_17662 [translate_table: standard]
METLEDVQGVLKLYKDGSIFRLEAPNFFAKASEQSLKDKDGGVASKDIVFNEKLGLWVRIYLPPTQQSRMPVIVYFHGGGFCLASPAHPDFHNLCVKLSGSVGVIIVSVCYRLAPEHRLPAAYEDCLAALEWLRSHAEGGGFEPETWLDSYAEFSQVYLLGDSAGANICHQVFLRSGGKDWSPLQIRGAIFLQPFFGAEERKGSEIECPKDAFLNLKLNDTYWRLSLPEDSNRDHPFSNPWGSDSPRLEDVQLPPLLVAIGGRDMLRDRAFDYCEALKKCGKQVEVILFEEEEHAFYALKLHSQSTNLLMQKIELFINSLNHNSVFQNIQS